MNERMKAVFFVDEQDGIPICPDCKVQIGEGEDHCTNCAFYEAEAEIVGLREMLNEILDCHYGVATHHIGDGDGIPDEMAEKIRAYWDAHLKRER